MVANPPVSSCPTGRKQWVLGGESQTWGWIGVAVGCRSDGGVTVGLRKTVQRKLARRWSVREGSMRLVWVRETVNEGKRHNIVSKWQLK